MTNEIGLREARKELGPLADRARYTGEITYLTRNGERIAAIVPLNRIATEARMSRNVISTNSHVDVTDEYAEAVDALLDKEIALRETYAKEHGQKTYRVWVAEYNAPGAGDTRWAVDYWDEASREVEEFDNREAAEERYEEFVRATAADLSLDEDGEPIPFTETDVPGVPGYDA